MIVDNLLLLLFIAAFVFSYMQEIIPSEVLKWCYLQLSTYYNIVCKIAAGRIKSIILSFIFPC